MLDPLDMLVFAKVVETTSFSAALRLDGPAEYDVCKTMLHRILVSRIGTTHA